MSSSRSTVSVPDERIPGHAERLLARPVTRADLALEFDESSASSAEVLVEGGSFYPRMLDDIDSASSSVHINQFGFRPGARRGCLRRGADRQGAGRPPGQARRRQAGLGPRPRLACPLRTAPRGGHPDLRCSRDESRVPAGPLGGGGATRWNLPRARAHRPPQGRDRRRPHRLGRRSGDRGPLPRRPLPRSLRPRHRAVVAQLQLVFLASFRWLGGEIPATELDVLFPPLEGGRSDFCPVLHNAPGRYRPITDAIARVLETATRRSTS